MCIRDSGGAAEGQSASLTWNGDFTTASLGYTRSGGYRTTAVSYTHLFYVKNNGSLEDYINIGRNIIFYIKIPFSLDVIEEIKKDEDRDVYKRQGRPDVRSA